MNQNINFLFDYIFPNMFLPNALSPDIAIMNYFTNMNSKNTIGCTINEKDVKISEDLLGYRDGDRPNSLSGFFFQTLPYSDRFIINYDSIYGGAHIKRKNFIYPIKPNPVFNNFLGLNTSNKRAFEGNYFWKYISSLATEYINAGQGKILIDYSMEPFIPKESYEAIHHVIKDSKLKNNSIIICVNSFNADKCYQDWFPVEERVLIVKNVPFCIDYSSWFYSQNQDKRMKIEDYHNIRNRHRKNYFLMKIRNDKVERSSLLFRLANKELLDKADWSFLSKKKSEQSHLSFNVIKELTKLDFKFDDKIDRLYKSLPHNLESENIEFHDINAWTDKDTQPYLNSYFEVCFETFIDYEHKSFTEKIFKPIINFLPFIFVSFPGSLQLLRDLGFKTFDGFINEEYDKISNPWERLEMISREIERLCNMSKEEIHNWYLEMNEILIHNHNHLINHHRNNLLGGRLINELSDFCNYRRLL